MALLLNQNIRSVLAAVQSTGVPAHFNQGHMPAPAAAEPFITLSREPGAGAWTLAQELVEELNRDLHYDQRPWTCWDKELVEKVVADHHLREEVVASLEESIHNWMTDFLSSLGTSKEAYASDEGRVYHRVAATIALLAKAGRVVIVGRGGVFVTHNMPGGIHVRLIAPLAARVEMFAAMEKISTREAQNCLAELEHRRRAFYKRYWPGKSLEPQTFTMTINSALVKGREAVKMIKALVEARLPASALASSRF